MGFRRRSALSLMGAGAALPPCRWLPDRAPVPRIRARSRRGRRWAGTAGTAYLALFNLRGEAREVGVDLRWLDLPREVRVHDLWSRADLGAMKGQVAQSIGAHGAGLYRLSW